MQDDILKQLSQVFCDIPFNRVLGLRLGRIENNAVSLNFNMQNDLIGNYMHGILHGGVISSVLDMAGGVAVMFDCVLKRPSQSFAELSASLSKTSTIDLQVSFIRPGKGTAFIATAHVVHGGNKISFAGMELHNQEHTLIATGKGTYLIS